ncbi:hypothetical protein BGW39_002574 [Mortierella sp. 14UC]|nr:hypothetical protein BGW39_002574 [Mortierella sp. 14UC]
MFRSATLFTVTLAMLLLAFVSTATAACYPNGGQGYRACIKEGFSGDYCDSMFLNSTCYRICLNKPEHPTRTVPVSDLASIVRKEFESVREMLAARDYPNFLSGSKLRAVIDEAQILSDKSPNVVRFIIHTRQLTAHAIFPDENLHHQKKKQS